MIIRSPDATRPWQHVIEPIYGYLKLAEKLFGVRGKNYVGSWNFGPNNINLNVLSLAKLGKKIFKSKSKKVLNIIKGMGEKCQQILNLAGSGMSYKEMEEIESD